MSTDKKHTTVVQQYLNFRLSFLSQSSHAGLRRVVAWWGGVVLCAPTKTPPRKHRERLGVSSKNFRYIVLHPKRLHLLWLGVNASRSIANDDCKSIRACVC